MDLLGDIFDTLDLRGVLYFRTDFSAPWSVQVPRHAQAARFHLVVQGRCHVRLESGRPLALGPGDLVLVPRGAAHVLSDAPTNKAPPLEQVLEQAGYDGKGVFVVGEGDPGASTQMVCGHFDFRAGADHPLLRALPDHLVTSAATRARYPLLDDVLRLITRRVFADQLGSAAAVTRLSEIVFIEVIRSGVSDNPELRTVVEAFQDPQIGRSLALIHTRPNELWTVERLAGEVAMSRSRFAERFSRLLGTAPMTYLADWRLQRALALLEKSQLSVKEIARHTGYQSPAAFTRAFSGKFGLPPTEYRRDPEARLEAR